MRLLCAGVTRLLNDRFNRVLSKQFVSLGAVVAPAQLELLQESHEIYRTELPFESAESSFTDLIQRHRFFQGRRCPDPSVSKNRPTAILTNSIRLHSSHEFWFVRRQTPAENFRLKPAPWFGITADIRGRAKPAPAMRSSSPRHAGPRLHSRSRRERLR